MIQITATDFKTHLGKYLVLAEREDVHITKNGTDIAVLTAPKTKKSWIDDIAGIIPEATDIDVKKTRTERVVKKYEGLD